MTIKYNFLQNKHIKNAKNLALFGDENFKIFNLKTLGLSNYNFINNLVQNNKSLKKKILIINVNEKQNLVVIKLNKNQSALENEKLGAEFYDFINSNLINNPTFIDQNFLGSSLNKNFIMELV